jgi:hypothetical protein
MFVHISYQRARSPHVPHSDAHVRTHFSSGCRSTSPLLFDLLCSNACRYPRRAQLPQLPSPSPSPLPARPRTTSGCHPVAPAPSAWLGARHSANARRLTDTSHPRTGPPLRVTRHRLQCLPATLGCRCPSPGHPAWPSMPCRPLAPPTQHHPHSRRPPPPAPSILDKFSEF